MSNFQYPTRSILLRLSFGIVITMSASGCLHALGLARPSISPRASLDIYDDSTVRAQDSEQTNTANAKPKQQPQASSGYSDFPLTSNPAAATATPRPVTGGVTSAPQARLLAPQFGGASPQETPQFDTALTPWPNADVPPQPQPSLGFSAQHVREVMNRQSQSEMATGDVLSEQPSRWSLLGSPIQNPITAFKAMGTTTGQTAATSISESKLSPDFWSDSSASSNAAESSDVATKVNPASVATETPAELSMLDRLKGFYEPENAARKIWKRPFQKLGNPWTAVFGERDENSPVDAVPAEAVPPLKADVPTEATMSVSAPLLTQLINATEAELAGWPTQPDGTPVNPERHQRRQLDLRLLYLIANQPGKAIRAVEELAGPEQDFWQELMLAMAEYRSQDTTDKASRLTNTNGQLRSAVRQLTPLTSLQIKRFEICSRIHSFGRLDSFGTNNFDPGQPLLLYAEVENFATELTPAGSYRTQFEAELKLYEEGNSKAKETIALPDISDESTSERSDYYQSFELSLPSHLKSGQYTIRLRLRDRISGKTAEGTVEFQVRQPESAELAGPLGT